MGLYRAVVQPLFFALPPELAHRLANRLLGLPLPWERIGGAEADPALEVTLAGIRLRNPIGLAAGFDKTCAHLAALDRLGFGYVVGGTITRAPRAGNPKPRIVRYRSRGSMVNAMGLPNPGAEARLAVGTGGLSGSALFVDTVRIVAEVCAATGGAVPISACGGVSTAEDALACLGAGATTVQVYSGLVYRGPRILRELTSGLAAAVRRREVDFGIPPAR